MSITLDGSSGILTPGLTSVSQFVEGNTSIVGTLSVSNAVTLSNSVVITGNATLSNTITVTGNATFGNTLTVSGNTGIGTATISQGKLAVYTATAGLPATSGSADANVAMRVWVSSIALDIGTYGNGISWIQNRLYNNYATNYDLVIQPNGGNLAIGTATASAKLTGPNTYANGTAITSGSSSVTTLDGFFIDCGIYS